jgi:hypothetical protein
MLSKNFMEELEGKVDHLQRIEVVMYMLEKC